MTYKNVTDTAIRVVRPGLIIEPGQTVDLTALQVNSPPAQAAIRAGSLVLASA